MTQLTKFKRQDFKKIIENYDIGRYRSHKHLWWALANTVYLLNTTKGKFILKIFEKSRPRFINYQVKVIDFLHGKNVSVPKIIKTRQNHSLLLYKNKRMLLQEFVQGVHPKKFNSALVRDLANKAGRLSKNLLKLKLDKRFTWGEHEFKPYKGKKEVQGLDMRSARASLLNDLKQLNKARLRKSMIHGDIRESNLLAKDNKIVAFVDWDDLHEDFLAYEIAVTLTDYFITGSKLEKDKVKDFLRTYQKHVKINDEDRKAIYFFIKHRYLGAISYCAEKSRTHKDRSKEIGKWISHITKQYRAIDKISLEEFVKLF